MNPQYVKDTNVAFIENSLNGAVSYVLILPSGVECNGWMGHPGTPLIDFTREVWWN